MPYRLIEHPTEKHGPRKGDPPIDMLVLHFTGLPTFAESLEALADGPKEVSSHYLIDTDGTVYHLVPESRRAWHAGVSYWRGERDINSRSIGIELQNPDGNVTPYPEAQVAALIPLCQDILARHPIPPRNVVGHSDIAPDRKDDPGILFPWRRLAEAGIGLWPDMSGTARGIEDVIPLLTDLGYDPEASDAVAAFQRRFRPGRVDGRLDGEISALAVELLKSAGRGRTIHK